jgi:uncharacterized protein (DUF2235 family)
MSAKTIVICSDGTGNTYSGVESNVLRLYRLVLKDDPGQVACYDPGLGTLPRAAGRNPLRRRLRHYSELMFGNGAIENVTQLYRFLMRVYEPDDRVFLFGFSRGAFTVRALAGLLHVSGLVRSGDDHLVEYATGLYETSEQRIKRALRQQGRKHFSATETDHAILDLAASQFKSTLSRPCSVTFMGIWDTVKAYGWMLPRSFPALRHNPSVTMVRQAVALDERRGVFQVTGWGDRRPATVDGRIPILEVWFAGDHSDVGGGHESGNTALSDATLNWMLGEATAAGLKLKGDPATRKEVNKIASGSLLAPEAVKHDLPRKSWRWRVPLPRVELNNRAYPPCRWPRMWPIDARAPSRHGEGEKEIYLHKSIQRRGELDTRYRPESILNRNRNPESEGVTRVVYVESQTATNFTDAQPRS